MPSRLTAARRRVWLILIAMALALSLIAALDTVRALADGLYDGPGEHASEREQYVWHLCQVYGWANDANPYVLMTVILAEAGPSLDYRARGDWGHSHGLAQLNDRPTGLLHHFYDLGYDDPGEPSQAVAYLSRAFGGEFTGSGIGPWRWTAWRRLGRPWVP